VNLSIMRNGKAITLKPTLSEAESASAAVDNAPALQMPQEDLAVKDLTPALRQRYQIQPNLDGVLVSQINPNGQASEKGVRPGDLITEINRQPVKSAAAFQAFYAKVKKGEVVLLALRRGSGSLVVAYEKP
jgi:serine protease Do